MDRCTPYQSIRRASFFGPSWTALPGVIQHFQMIPTFIIESQVKLTLPKVWRPAQMVRQWLMVEIMV